MNANDSARYLEGQMHSIYKAEERFERGILTFSEAQKGIESVINDSRDVVLCNGNSIDKAIADVFIRFMFCIKDVIDYFDINYNW